MTTQTITATAPNYATDGSRGYHLVTTNAHGVEMHGWIAALDGRRVMATLDRRGWQVVGTVDSRADLTPEWVKQHTAEILAAF